MFNITGHYFRHFPLSLPYFVFTSAFIQSFHISTCKNIAITYCKNNNHFHSGARCLQSVIENFIYDTERAHINSVFCSLPLQHVVCKTSIVVCTMCCVENKLFGIEYKLNTEMGPPSLLPHSLPSTSLLSL